MQNTENYAKKQFNREYGEYGTKFEFGSNPSSELWNGRLAMLGFAAALIIELVSGQGLLHFWGLM